MKVYVINLDRSPERLAHMQAELGRLGIAFERMPAVDGATLSAAETAEWTRTPMANGTVLTAGEIGCILSHRECWQAAAAAGEPAAVFEDDVFLGDDAAAFLSGDAWIPTDADIVKLETFVRPTLIDKRSVPANDRSLARLRSIHAGTGGYVVSAVGAAKLMTLSRDSFLPLDHFMFDPASPAFVALLSYQLSPAICVQEHVAASRRGKRAGMRAMGASMPSALRTQRTDRRPAKSMLTRIGREVRRPFERLAARIARAVTTATTARRWTTVEFR